MADQVQTPTQTTPPPAKSGAPVQSSQPPISMPPYKQVIVDSAPPPEGKPLISFTSLFIIGLVIACLALAGSILLQRMALFAIPSEVAQTQTQTPTSAPSSEPAAPTRSVKKTTSLIPGWKLYTDDVYGYTFQYPSEYRLEKIPKGSTLISGVNLYLDNYRDPLFKVLIWNQPTPLGAGDYRRWCFDTLKEEARQLNILCDFLSPAALDQTTVAEKNAYKINYYNSGQEKVDFYLISRGSTMMTIHVVTTLDDSRRDNGESKAKDILKTVQFDK